MCLGRPRRHATSNFISGHTGLCGYNSAHDPTAAVLVPPPGSSLSSLGVRQSVGHHALRGTHHPAEAQDGARLLCAPRDPLRHLSRLLPAAALLLLRRDRGPLRLLRRVQDRCRPGHHQRHQQQARRRGRHPAKRHPDGHRRARDGPLQQPRLPRRPRPRAPPVPRRPRRPRAHHPPPPPAAHGHARSPRPTSSSSPTPASTPNSPPTSSTGSSPTTSSAPTRPATSPRSASPSGSPASSTISSTKSRPRRSRCSTCNGVSACSASIPPTTRPPRPSRTSPIAAAQARIARILAESRYRVMQGIDPDTIEDSLDPSRSAHPRGPQSTARPGRHRPLHPRPAQRHPRAQTIRRSRRRPRRSLSFEKELHAEQARLLSQAKEDLRHRHRQPEPDPRRARRAEG